ncbi:centrosomal protein of 78 kDa-like isoform X2 [Ptychodera flava]|uniref:centrosomal protein of 78 kDa-like isoform X2 n=1 Tax=Ptychodera flava TaxID=63121 RepID=UPI003969FD4B
MIESVQARHLGAYDFASHYDNLCMLQNSCPLQSVKAHIHDDVLDINADRIRLNDWTPILNSIKINRHLRFIGIRSYYQYVTGEGISIAKKFAAKKKAPAIRHKDVTHRLAQALKECLTVTQSLTVLELQGLPLREKDLSALAKGFVKNISLRHLSLEYCRIGDVGVDIICQGIKNSANVQSLNLSGCSMTWKGAETLAKVIKHQATKRHSEAWQDSLRYRRPDLDRMSGLRRLTMNCNSLVNDNGARAMADSLHDDLWLKALDMQQCGISDAGAKAFLEVLKSNSTLMVLDLRRNPLIDRDLLKDVMEQVLINSGGGQAAEFKWLKISSKEVGKKVKSRKKTRTLNSAFGRKTTIRISSSASKAQSRSAVLSKTRHPAFSQPEITKPGPGFVPWRTAARANRHRDLPVDRDPGTLSIDANCETAVPDVSSSIHVHRYSTHSDGNLTSENSTPISNMKLLQHDKYLKQQSMLEMSHTEEVKVIKDLQIELEEVKRRFYVESRTRAAADARIIELEVENSRLKHHLQIINARGPSSPFRSKPQGGDFEFEDESVLDSIESSFNKFHAFLDLLRDAGLGQLCTLVGLTPKDIREPGVATILKQYQPQSYSSSYHQPASELQQAWKDEPQKFESERNRHVNTDLVREEDPTQKEQQNDVHIAEILSDSDEVKYPNNQFEVAKDSVAENGGEEITLTPFRMNLENDVPMNSLQDGLSPVPIIIGNESRDGES